MATSNRDVKMTLSVQALGVDEVKKLEASINKLADEGGKAAPEFQKLASEVNKLGQQSAALATFQKLADETAALAQKDALAAASVKDLSDKLVISTASANAAATEQKRLADAHAAAKTAFNSSRDALATLSATTDAAGKKEAAYLQKVEALKLAKIAERAELEKATAALAAANSEATKAAAEKSKHERALRTATAAAAAEAAALRENAAAVRQAEAAAQALGVSTANVSAAQAALIQGLNAAGKAAAAKKAADDELRESDRLLAIQEKALAAQAEATRIALLAEGAAQRDVAALARKLAAEKTAAAAATAAAAQAAAAAALKWQQEADAIVIAAEAARKAKRDADLLADAERFLAAEAARAALALKAAADAQAQMAAAAATAAQELKNAFSTIGVRSAKDLQAEIDKVNAAMNLVRTSGTTTGAALANAMALGDAKVKELERDMRALNGALTIGDKAAAAAKELKDAFSVVGVRSAKDLQAEIDKLNAALALIRTSGTSTGAALAAAMAAGDAKVKELERSMRALNGTLTTGDQAAATAEKLKNAFGVIGVRSAQQLQAEIDKVRAAMTTVGTSGTTTGAALNSAFASGEARIKALERELRAVNGALTAGDRAAGLFANSLGQIAAGNIVADGVGYLVGKVKELGVEFLGAIVGGDQLRRGLTAIYKDAGVVAAQIDFLKKSSSESGVAFGGLAKDFVKFSASMKSANIQMQDSNNLFKAVTGASASLGLSADATTGILNAFSQMAGKGVLSLEELRSQCADRLPGAMGLAAKALGLTEGQLIALVSSGQLATRDFIVPFTQALKGMQGETDGLVPAWERLKGFFTEMAQNIGDAGAIVLLTGVLKTLGFYVGSLFLGLSALVEGFFLVGSAVVAVTARMSGDASAWEFFSQQVEKSAERLTNQARTLTNFVTPAAAEATAAMTTNTAAVTASIQANTSLSSAQKLTALSTALAADATLNAAAKIVQYNVAATELISLQEKQTEAYAKLAKAAKEEGDTLVALAKLSGDKEAITRASVAAAELHAAALARVAKSQADETAMLVAQKAELVASAASRGLSALQIKTQTDALEKLIVQSRAETEAANQASLAAKTEVFERQLAVKTLQDHSAEIVKYRAEVTSAAETLARYTELQTLGLATDEQVKQKRDELSIATVLYKDALADAIGNTDAETRAKQANLQMSIAQSATAQKHLEVLAAQSRALGDTAQAQYYEIQAKEQAIATLKLEMQMRALEAEAQKITIELKRLEITGSDDLSVKKRALLDVELSLLKVKMQANETAKEVIKGIENEIAALRDGAGARDGYTSGIRRSTAALRENTRAKEENKDAESDLSLKEQAANRSKEEEARSLNGRRAAVDASAPFLLREKERAGELSADDLAVAEAALQTAKNNKQSYDANWSAFSNEGAQSIFSELNSATVLYEKVKALADAKASASKTVAAPSAPSVSAPATAPQQTAAAAPARVAQTVVQIIIPDGRTRNINTDAAGASTLQSMMKELFSAQGTSSSRARS